MTDDWQKHDAAQEGFVIRRVSCMRCGTYHASLEELHNCSIYTTEADRVLKAWHGVGR